MTEYAPAKVNLTLHMIGRRPDGYHLMESLVAFASLQDVLHAELSETLSLNVTGEFAADAGEGESNLVLKAAARLQAATKTTKGAAMTLEKNIPVGAGLGGGSADAAATLRLLNRLWDTKQTEEDLLELAKPIGADVAMCLFSKPAIATGIGDVMTFLPEPLPAIHAVLVHPRTPLLTADVYRALHLTETAAAKNKTYKIRSYKELIASLHQSHNDLQAPALQVSPVLSTLMEALQKMTPTPDIIRMTGSGACCFALYEHQEDAEQAASTLSKAHPQWWVRAAVVR